VDFYAANHGLEEEVPTYSRGTKRLDYILMTPTVASHVARCGADPFNHQFFSDHRGIYVDLELEGLFDRKLPPLARPAYRDIRSGSPRLIITYIMELNQYFVEHNIPERMDRLAESRDDLVAETLDQDITNGMLLAGSKCEADKRLPKSGKLHEAQTALRIYQNVLSQLKNKRNLTPYCYAKPNEQYESLPEKHTTYTSNIKIKRLRRLSIQSQVQQKKRSSNASKELNTLRPCFSVYPQSSLSPREAYLSLKFLPTYQTIQKLPKNGAPSLTQLKLNSLLWNNRKYTLARPLPRLSQINLSNQRSTGLAPLLRLA
jgi:hypothetical protein